MIEIPLTFSVILIGAIIAQGIFAGLLLLNHQSNPKANKFLGALLLFFSLWLLHSFFDIANVFQQNPNFYFLPIYYSLAFGPLIYFYTSALTQANFKFKKIYLLHFIPATVQACLYFFLQIKDYSFRRWFWQEIHWPYTYNLEFSLSLISMIIYLILSIYLVRKYQKWIRNQYSEVSKINLRWLTLVQLVIAVLCLVWLVDVLLRELWNYYPSQAFSTIAIGISILILAFGSLRQKNLMHLPIQEIEKISLKPEIIIDSELLQKIKTKMGEDKYYLDPKLSLDSFSNAIQERPREVSYHINQGIGVSFIDFVNDYRVGEFKRKTKDEKFQHLTLLGMALESGFNSKSTFNRVFKKITGKSPSNF